MSERLKRLNTQDDEKARELYGRSTQLEREHKTAREETDRARRSSSLIESSNPESIYYRALVKTGTIAYLADNVADQAGKHYRKHKDAYQNQAVSEAQAAGVDVDFRQPTSEELSARAQTPEKV